MKTYIIIFLTVLISAISQSDIKAQKFEWVRNQTHDIQLNPNFAGFPSASDNSGNSLIASIENHKLSWSLNFLGDFSLRKYSLSGTPEFKKVFEGMLMIDGIQTDDDRSIYIKGIFMDTLRLDSIDIMLNTGSGFNVNYFLIKLNENGKFVWGKNYSADPGNYYLSSIKVKNNFLLAGIGNFSNRFIKKYDSDGIEIQSIIISSASSLNITSMDMDNSGNIVAGGSCSGGNITFGGLQKTAPFSYNVFIAKFNSSGSGLWAKFVEDITFQNISVALDNQGNTFAAGDLSGSFLFDTIQTQGNQWVYDFFLTRLDNSGNFLWVKEVPYLKTIGGDVQKGKYNCISLDINDNIYFTGMIRGSIDWGNNVTTTASGFSDVLILKYDRMGNIISGKVAGGSGSDRADGISTDKKGNVFVAGNFSESATFDSIKVSGKGYINSFITKFYDSNIFGILNLTLLIEGFYDESLNTMRIADSVRVYLRNSTAPFEVSDSSLALIDPDTFSGECKFYNAEDRDYYLHIKHRNSIETWSSIPVSYTRGGMINYDFSGSDQSAFGNNLKLADSSPVRYALYSGDPDQDGFIDLSDMVVILNDMNNFINGYVPSDINGNNVTDLSDLIITNNNAINFIQLIRP